MLQRNNDTRKAEALHHHSRLHGTVNRVKSGPHLRTLVAFVLRALSSQEIDETMYVHNDDSGDGEPGDRTRFCWLRS